LPTATSDELMPKSADAFRTISEVAEWLEIQAHVLRFWESKFTQVKPIKRAGGRRYYRPADMLLLGGIKRLLHDDGLTIKGVQKILREEGMNHVSSLSAPLDELSQADLDSDQDTIDMPDILPEADEAKAAENVVLPFNPPRDTSESEPEADPEPTIAQEPVSEETTPEEAEPPEDLPAPKLPTPPAQTASEPPSEPEKPAQQEDEPMAPVTVDKDTATPVPVAEENPAAEENSTNEDADTPASDTSEPDNPKPEPAPEEEPKVAAEQELPTFLRRPLTDLKPEPDAADAAPEPESDLEAAPTPPPAPKPRIIDLPPLTAEEDIKASPGALSAALRGVKFSAEQAADIAPLLTRLAALRDSMSAPQPPAAKD